MLTDRQQSFLATLHLQDRPLNTLDALLGKPAWVNWFGGASTLPQLASTVRNDSSMLSCQPGVGDQAVLLYFRYSEGGYRLYSRTPGEHFGKGVWLHGHGHLGLVSTRKQAPTTLRLQTLQGDALALSELAGSQHPVWLITEQGHVHPRQRLPSPFEYLGGQGQTPLTWSMTVIEREVPWLSSPDEV
ncbi:hypothetical protein ACE1YR_05695 [Pseudomonas sp. K1(2024)]|uniref:Uncharacterized protein n=2 Tax=Pseudomonas TaxID=286 RepID=A0AAI8KE13_9PSED|nr:MULTISPECIES: hypothetical protein [Pseudomonas]AIZ34185.1 hypothetical protein NJ69_14865 [Pseudomonas parafulva]AXO89903.1 hypothetical protein DZC75_18530 [Pseudomonas parafulva]MDO7903446.1 hypothetical protein [Pseudomonas sp. K13]